MVDYEARVEVAYRDVLSAGDRAIDVGAHRGRHAIPMAEQVGAEGWVLAFEPLPTARAVLVAAVREDRRRGAPRGVIEIHEEALADRSGSAEFVFVPGLPECSGLRERVYDAPVEVERIAVRLARLDDVIGDRGPFRLIKIDAEGGEHDIVVGAAAVLRRDRPVVLFELGDNALVNYPGVTSAGVFDQLDGLDYRLLDILGRPLDRAAFIASCAEQSVWDYAAVPADQDETFESLRRVLAEA